MYQLTKQKKRVYCMIDELNTIAKYIMGDYTLIAYDTETTGITVGSFPVQVTAMKMVKQNGVYTITDTLNEYIKPPIPMPEEASSVNGLTDEILADKPSEKEIFPKIRNFFGDINSDKSNIVIFGYNSKSFDTQKIMDPFYKRCGVREGFKPAREFDSFAAAKEILDYSIMPTGDDGKQHMRLMDVASLYNIKGEHFHDARTDVEITVKVTWALYNDFVNTYINYGWEKKPRIQITGARKFNPSHWTDYIYFTVTSGSEKGRLCYDKRNKKIIEENGHIFDNGNLPLFEQDMKKYIKEGRV